MKTSIPSVAVCSRTSVFECEVDEMHFERLIQAIVKIIHKEEDSLRI